MNPLAGQDGQHAVKANTLTIDHKPEDPNEIARIERQGQLLHNGEFCVLTIVSH